MKLCSSSLPCCSPSGLSSRRDERPCARSARSKFQARDQIGAQDNASRGAHPLPFHTSFHTRSHRHRPGSFRPRCALVCFHRVPPPIARTSSRVSSPCSVSCRMARLFGARISGGFDGSPRGTSWCSRLASSWARLCDTVHSYSCARTAASPSAPSLPRPSGRRVRRDVSAVAGRDRERVKFARDE